MVASVPVTGRIEIADKRLLDYRAQEALGVVSRDSILDPAGLGAINETAGLQDVEDLILIVNAEEDVHQTEIEFSTQRGRSGRIL